MAVEDNLKSFMVPTKTDKRFFSCFFTEVGGKWGETEGETEDQE